MIGLGAGVVCQLAIRLKYKFGYDDSLDVLALHGVAGLFGMIMIGLFATKAANPAGADGLFYGGGFDQLWRQSVAAVAALVFAFTITFLIAWLIRATIGFRVTGEVESVGIDEAEHAETAYEFSSVAGMVRSGTTSGAGASSKREESNQ